MKTAYRLAMLLASTMSLFACAPAEEGEDDGDVSATQDPVVATSACTAEKSGTLYKAEAKVTTRGLLVKIDGVEGRDKNKISVDARYEDGATASLQTSDNQPGGQWVTLPFHVQTGARYSLNVEFDLSFFNRSCKIDLQN